MKIEGTVRIGGLLVQIASERWKYYFRIKGLGEVDIVNKEATRKIWDY